MAILIWRNCRKFDLINFFKIFAQLIRLEIYNLEFYIKKLIYCRFVSSIRLQKLSAFDNEIKFVPSSLLQIPTLTKLNLARNNITSLYGDPDDSDDISSVADSETWGCTALKVLNLSHNNLQYLPRGVQGAAAMTKLLLDHNNLREFPMPWKCPLVSLKLELNLPG